MLFEFTLAAGEEAFAGLLDDAAAKAAILEGLLVVVAVLEDEAAERKLEIDELDLVRGLDGRC